MTKSKSLRVAATDINAAIEQALSLAETINNLEEGDVSDVSGGIGILPVQPSDPMYPIIVGGMWPSGPIFPNDPIDPSVSF